MPGVTCREYGRGTNVSFRLGTRLADILCPRTILAGPADTDAAEQIGRLAAQLAESGRCLQQAAARIEAGTRMLHALSALARSWEAAAGQCASPEEARAPRRFAAGLRDTVRRAHQVLARPGEDMPAGRTPAAADDPHVHAITGGPAFQGRPEPDR